MDFNLDDIPSQKGKTAIITGANTGLGFETAVGLAKTGATVIMACRNMNKAAAAKAQVLAKVPNADLETMQLDLSSFASVREFATNYKNKYAQLDLLINNAGIMFPPYSKTEDGFESQFAVNHLGHFLLTALLFELMPDNSEARIVSLSSNAHKFGKINFDDLQSEKKYSATAAYGQSKLACLMFADELQRRLIAGNKKILSVCAHPGVAPTELSRYMPNFLVTVIRWTIAPLITHPVDEAALPTLLAALGSDVKGGEYFGPQGSGEMKGKPGRAIRAEHGTDEQVAKRLWQVSEELTSCKFVI